MFWQRVFLLSMLVVSSFVIFLSGCSMQPSTPTIAPQRAAWTIMMYMAADNDLYNIYFDQDWEAMKAVGSTERVHLVAFVDRESTHRANYYYIRRGDSENLQELDSVNSGDGQTLLNFISFAKQRYPAERYALILWNHGGGWRISNKGIGEDWANQKDLIEIPELANALSQAGVHFSLIGMDACRMATIEVAYEIRACGDVMVASQIDTWYSFPYRQFLQSLVQNPTMDASSLAREIIDNYVAAGTDRVLSAIELDRVEPLAQALSNHASLLMTRLRSNDSSFSPSSTKDDKDTIWGEDVYLDIYNYAQATLNNPNPAVSTSAQSILDCLQEAVDYLRANGTSQNQHGLSVFFPDRCSLWDLCSTKYEELAFSAFQWDELIDYICAFGGAP